MILPNYAVALLLFAIIIKAILFPLGIKQQKNMVKQAKLKPKDAAIRKRYAGRTDKATQQKMNEEIMKLQQSENVSPFSGCMPLLIEMPILFALYNVVTSPLRYICNFTAETITAIGEKSKELGEIIPKIADMISSSGSRGLTQIQMVEIIRDNFAEFVPVINNPEFTVKQLPVFTVFGSAFNLAESPTFTFSPFNWLLIIPVLTFFASFFSMRLTRKFSYVPEQSGDAGKSMKIMDFTMPLMSVWFTFMFPAVMGVYWIYQNILTFVRQVILAKLYPFPVFTEEDYKQAEKEMNGKLSKNERKQLNSAKKVRSLHRIDDEPDPEPEEKDDEEPPKEGLIKRAELKDEDDKK